MQSYNIVREQRTELSTSFPGLSSLPSLVVGRETLVAAGHVTINPSKTAAAGWVGTQVHLVERTINYHPGEGEVKGLLVSKWRLSF